MSGWDLSFTSPPALAHEPVEVDRAALLSHLRPVVCEDRISSVNLEPDFSVQARASESRLFVRAPSLGTNGPRLPTELALRDLPGLVRGLNKNLPGRLATPIELDVRENRLRVDWGNGSSMEYPLAEASTSLSSYVTAHQEAKVFGKLGQIRWEPVDKGWIVELRRTLEAVENMNPSQDREVDNKQIPGTRVVVPLGKWSYVPLRYEPRAIMNFATGELQWSYEVGNLPELPPDLMPDWKNKTAPRKSGSGGTRRFEAAVPEFEAQIELPVDLLQDVCKTVVRTAGAEDIDLHASFNMLAFRTSGFAYAMPLGNLLAELQ